MKVQGSSINHRRRLRLVGWSNGAGIERNLQLVEEVARTVGIETYSTSVPKDGRLGRYSAILGRIVRKVDIQLALEHLSHRMLASAKRTWLVPNAEWFEPDWRPLVGKIDRFLVKSKHAVDIFSEIGGRTVHYVGWTTIDRRIQRAIKLDWQHPLHVAGRSRQKGTAELIELWRRRPDLPLLTIVAREGIDDPRLPNVKFIAERLSENQLVSLLNTHRLHLCPSNAEGFGHTLGEGLSVGAVVLTTDAAPMNELVDDVCGVTVPARRSRAMGLDRWHALDSDGLEVGVEQLLSLGAEEREQKSESARRRWEEYDGAFRNRLAEQLLEVL